MTAMFLADHYEKKEEIKQRDSRFWQILKTTKQINKKKTPVYLKHICVCPKMDGQPV